MLETESLETCSIRNRTFLAHAAHIAQYTGYRQVFFIFCFCLCIRPIQWSWLFGWKQSSLIVLIHR